MTCVTRAVALAGLAGLLVGGCSSARSEAASDPHAPLVDVAPIASGDLCLTRGVLAGGAVDDPTFRGYMRGTDGEAAQLTFTYRGAPADVRELAGGQARRQIGLKLRAQDGCNVVYVMWRLDPRPKLDVSVKLNPLGHTHEQCGADGYTKLRPARKFRVPAFGVDSTHTLRAEIVRDELSAWIDGRMVWQGRLPPAARALRGPAGVRSDNVRFDLVELAAPQGAGTAPACKPSPDERRVERASGPDT